MKVLEYGQRAKNYRFIQNSANDTPGIRFLFICIHMTLYIKLFASKHSLWAVAKKRMKKT